MVHKPKDKHRTTLTPRQQKLDFACAKHWQHLPRTDQHACRQLLTKLLCQVISESSQEDDDEREDSTATS